MIRCLIFPAILLAACGGTGLAIDDQSAPVSVTCYLDLTAPQKVTVESPDARCLATPDGRSFTVSWGNPDAPWTVSASLDDQSVLWEKQPCETSVVSKTNDGISFDGELVGAPVRGRIGLLPQN